MVRRCKGGGAGQMGRFLFGWWTCSKNDCGSGCIRLTPQCGNGVKSDTNALTSSSGSQKSHWTKIEVHRTRYLLEAGGSRGFTGCLCPLAHSSFLSLSHLLWRPSWLSVVRAFVITLDPGRSRVLISFQNPYLHCTCCVRWQVHNLCALQHLWGITVLSVTPRMTSNGLGGRAS
jgi:hypothetical protein